MPFVKLDCGILNSSLWSQNDVRSVFLTALLMATPRHFDIPQKQIAVDSLKETGFVVPPGDYGFIEAAGQGILHLAHVSQSAGMKALRLLGEPEADSRSKDFQGRRLVRVDGGFIALNYSKYREKDYSAASRMKRYRARKRYGVTLRNVTQAEAEADNISLPTLSTNPPQAAPKPATKPNEERVQDDHEEPKETKTEEQTEAWKAWHEGFKKTSPIGDHSQQNLQALGTLHGAWGHAGLVTAATCFRRDCDSGRIKVASLSTFLKCQKNYAPKIPIKPEDKQASMIATGKDALIQRLNSVGKSRFWSGEPRDIDYYARWYAYLAARAALPSEIPAP